MQKCAKSFTKPNLLQNLIFKRDLWASQWHFHCYFQGLYVFSINFKKIENSLWLGVRPQPLPQWFYCGYRNRKAGYDLPPDFFFFWGGGRDKKVTLLCKNNHESVKNTEKSINISGTSNSWGGGT